MARAPFASGKSSEKNAKNTYVGLADMFYDDVYMMIICIPLKPPQATSKGWASEQAEDIFGQRLKAKKLLIKV